MTVFTEWINWLFTKSFCYTLFRIMNHEFLFCRTVCLDTLSLFLFRFKTFCRVFLTFVLITFWKSKTVVFLELWGISWLISNVSCSSGDVNKVSPQDLLPIHLANYLLCLFCSLQSVISQHSRLEFATFCRQLCFELLNYSWSGDGFLINSTLTFKRSHLMLIHVHMVILGFTIECYTCCTVKWLTFAGNPNNDAFAFPIAQCERGEMLRGYTPFPCYKYVIGIQRSSFSRCGECYLISLKQNLCGNYTASNANYCTITEH